MNARLLAWGGNAYVWRNKLGKWPEFPTSDLEDLSLLPQGGGATSFGVGLAGGTPFIIFRERQTEKDRGGYAYTLLLDPGQAAWQAAGWNPARVCRVLMDSDLGPVLRFHPETITAQRQLDECVSACVWTSAEPLARPGPDDLVEWIGASGLASAVVVLNESPVGYERRPTWSGVEASLDGLPPCLRCARGWLIGGRRGNAVAFGCGLVLDDRRPPDQTEPQGVLPRDACDQALRLARAWTQLRERPDESGEAQQWFERPLWEWGNDTAAVVRRLLLLADLNGNASGSTAEAVAQELVSDGPLGESLLREFVAWAANQTTRLPAAVTRVLVRHQVHPSDQATRVASRGRPLTVDSFDPDALVNTIHELGLQPNTPSVARLGLSTDVTRRLWDLVLGDVPVTDLPKTLGMAWANLESVVAPGTAAHTLKAGIAGRAMVRCRIESHPLAGWSGLAATEVWRDVLPARLRDEARRRVLARIPSWQGDYLLFAQDEDLAWLVENAPTAVVELVEYAGHAVAREPLVNLRCRALLVGLALSPLRDRLPIDLKIRISQAIKGPWEPLLVVQQLWEGQVLHGETSPVSVDQRHVLSAELAALSSATETLKTPPNLSALRDYLGRPVDAEVAARAVSMIPVARDAATTAKWLRTLAGHVPDESLRVIARQHWTDGPDTSSDLAPWLGDEHLSGMLADLLCQPRSNRSRHVEPNLIALARSQPSVTRDDVSPIETGVLLALQGTSASVAVERMLSNTELLDELSPHLSRPVWETCVVRISTLLADQFDSVMGRRFLDLHRMVQEGRDPSFEPSTVRLLATLLEPRLAAHGRSVAANALGPDAWEFGAIVKQWADRTGIQLPTSMPKAPVEADPQSGTAVARRPWWAFWQQ